MATMIKRLFFAFAILATLGRPACADGWFPVLNSHGEIASGSGTLTVNGRDLGPGWLPRWVDDDHVVFSTSPAETVLLDVRSGSRVTLAPGFNVYAAGGGLWMGLFAGPSQTVLRRYSGTVVAWEAVEGAMPTVSRAGRYGYATPYHQDQKTIYVADMAIAAGLVMNLSVSDQATVWSVASGRQRLVLGARPGAAVESLAVLEWEEPIACDGPAGPWIVSVTQTGLMAHAWGSRRGFFTSGEYFNPDCLFLNGRFRVVSSSGRGELQVTDVDPSASTDLSTVPSWPAS